MEPATPPVVTGHRDIAGVRVSALVEVVLLLGALIAFDATFLERTGFAGVTPHPFWLVVLLLAGQYGSREGLVAAAAVSVTHLAFGWPEQSIHEDYHDFLWAALRLPFLWCAAAVAFGELRMRHVAERTELTRALSESDTHARTLAEAYERLRKIKETLETRVASQLETTTTMYRASQAIDKLDPTEVIEGVSDIVRAVMSPDQFSLFVLKEGALVLETSDGWSGQDRYDTTFSAGTALFQEVVGRQRILCTTRRADEQLLDNQGLLAGPILRPETGAVIGMLKIERLGFLRLTSTSLSNFGIVCDWVATAYGKAERFQEAERDRVLDGDTQLYSHTFLPRQTDYVSVLARRLGFDLSTVTVHLDNAEVLSVDEREHLPSVLRETVGYALRRTDLAFHETDSDLSYVLLLPGTPLDKTEIVIRKLKEGLAERLEGSMTRARFAFTADSVHQYERPASFRETLFPRQTEFLTDLAQRFGFDLSMIRLRVDNIDEVVEEDRRLIPGAINLYVARLLSESSPPFTYERLNWEFPVVLPGVAQADAEALADQLVRLVGAYLESNRSRAKLSFTVEHMTAETEARVKEDLLHA